MNLIRCLNIVFWDKTFSSFNVTSEYKSYKQRSSNLSKNWTWFFIAVWISFFHWDKIFSSFYVTSEYKSYVYTEILIVLSLISYIPYPPYSRELEASKQAGRQAGPDLLKTHAISSGHVTTLIHGCHTTNSLSSAAAAAYASRHASGSCFNHIPRVDIRILRVPTFSFVCLLYEKKLVYLNYWRRVRRDLFLWNIVLMCDLNFKNICDVSIGK